MIDAHIHLDKRVLDYHNIIKVYNIGSLEEYSFYQRQFNGELYSIGVHPWDSNKKNLWSELKKFSKKASYIGEIGMDNVWCNINEGIQESVFREQLFYASKHNKSVILHTKGKEEHIANIISEYKNIYIVHWFTDDNSIQSYIDLDCYFTIGPAVLIDDTIKQILPYIPLNRVLVESDGLKALEWLFKKKLSKKCYYKLLSDTYEYLAMYYKCELEEFKEQVITNFEETCK